MSGEEEAQRPKQKASAFEAVKAVLWSFVGIRRRSGYDADAAKLTPMQVIVTGVIAGVVFVVTILVVVRLVLATYGSGN
jgi:hypothetical protein